MQRGQYGCDVVPSPGASQESGCSVLDQLETGHGGLGDSGVEGVTVVQTGGYEGMNDNLQVMGRQKWFDFGNGAEVEETSFDSGVDLFVKFKSGIKKYPKIFGMRFYRNGEVTKAVIDLLYGVRGNK